MEKAFNLADFMKEQRGVLGLTQENLAAKAGVGLRFIRDMEQGKSTLRMDKVNQVLVLFGCQLGPVCSQEHPGFVANSMAEARD
ncbi:MAG: helix-turn-helix transcriptional regulator [Leptospirales bacterium]